MKNHALPEDIVADIVIDHHPVREEHVHNPFADLGGAYGATSHDADRVPAGGAARAVARAGHRAVLRHQGRHARPRAADAATPTSTATCGCSRASSASCSRSIEHPELPLRYFRLYHAAIEKARLYSSAVITDLGEVYSPDMVAEVSERLSFLEGAKWSLAFGSYRSQLYLSACGCATGA